MKHFFIKLQTIFDYLKDMLIFAFLVVFSVVFFSTIIHNILKVVQYSEIDNRNKYGTIVETENGEKINVYSIGNGEKTIVILSGFGVQSPAIVYKDFATKMSQNYKVVVIEYPGYGFSIGSENSRNNANIATDIRNALISAKISGPYILMPHSISNLYAMKFVEMFPNDVQSVISIDGFYSAMIQDNKGKEYILNTMKTIKFASKIEWTGIYRILSYVKPDIYNIDLLKKCETIDDEDIKLYRKLIATNYLTKSMNNESDLLEKNVKELENYKYPENLPVLEILAKNTIDEYNTIFSKNYLENLAKQTISNDEIQSYIILKGTHMLHLSNEDELVSEIIEFVQ